MLIRKSSCEHGLIVKERIAFRSGLRLAFSGVLLNLLVKYYREIIFEVKVLSNLYFFS